MREDPVTEPEAMLRVRPMTATDVDTVCALAAESAQAPHWPREVYCKALEAETPQRLALVVEWRGEVAGFAVVCLIPPEAELESIAVGARFRRMGAGRALLESIKANLKQQKVMALWLEVRSSNHAALALYQSEGFRQTGVRNRYYADPIEDAVLMALALPEKTQIFD